MGDPLLGLGNLVPKETVTKLYDDVMAGPAKEGSGIGAAIGALGGGGSGAAIGSKIWAQSFFLPSRPGMTESLSTGFAPLRWRYWQPRS